MTGNQTIKGQQSGSDYHWEAGGCSNLQVLFIHCIFQAFSLGFVLDSDSLVLALLD